MITHKYRSVDVPVSGGLLRVGVWDPVAVPEGAAVPSALLIHGVTSSHLVWPFVVSQLPGTRLIAPDLRGRGSSRAVSGSGGMAAHANDMVAVLDALAVASLPVIGHSMGAFVAVTLSHLAPDRVEQLVLIDGGLPLDLPAGLSSEQIVQGLLGLTAKRLSMRFRSVGEYLDFWREHPAFLADWSPEIEHYFAYDLVPEGEQLKAATSLEVMSDDTLDMNTGASLVTALGALTEWAKPVTLVSVPRGLNDETPGIYAPEHLARMLEEFPTVRHVRFSDFNHYTVVMSAAGAAELKGVLRFDSQE